MVKLKKSRRMMFSLPEPVVERLERISLEKNVTKSVVINLALEEYEKTLKGGSNNNGKN